MTTNPEQCCCDDIHKIAYDLLKQSKALGVFPTPVNELVAYAELYVQQGRGLHDIPNHYISRKIDVLRSALTKVFGALDRRQKIIYLEPSLLDVKKNFVQLHEVGHHALPWQKAVWDHVEDEKTLSADVKEDFEAEANFFASAVLFQLDRFDQLAQTLPLGIKSARYLAKHFGGSIHATLRRYVQTLPKRCGLLVLTPDDQSKHLLLRDYFASGPLSTSHGDLSFPGTFNHEWPFVLDHWSHRKVIDQAKEMIIVHEGSLLDFEYQYFNNRYNTIFVLFYPKGEHIRSRTQIIMRGE